MSCNCVTAKTIPLCATNLFIGEADSAIDYNVILKTPTGRIDIYEAVFNYGSNAFFITDFSLRTDTQYEIWLTRVDAGNINERTTFTIDDNDEVECVLIEFSQAFDTSNTTEVFESQTITLEEDD